MADTGVKFTGPLFDGRADVALREGITAVRHRLASAGEKLVTASFAASIREEVAFSTISRRMSSPTTSSSEMMVRPRKPVKKQWRQPLPRKALACAGSRPSWSLKKVM